MEIDGVVVAKKRSNADEIISYATINNVNDINIDAKVSNLQCPYLCSLSEGFAETSSITIPTMFETASSSES